jgi:hypothetical protein
MSSRSASALESCGCTSTISWWKRANAGYGDRQNIFCPDRVLDRLDRRIEALDVTHHQGNAGVARRGNNGASLGHGRRDGLLNQYVHPTLDAIERQLLVQVGGRRNGHGVDADCQQLSDVREGRTGERTRHHVARLAVGIRHTDEAHAGKIGKDPCMVAAHDADADDADTQWAL